MQLKYIRLDCPLRLCLISTSNIGHLANCGNWSPQILKSPRLRNTAIENTHNNCLVFSALAAVASSSSKLFSSCFHWLFQPSQQSWWLHILKLPKLRNADLSSDKSEASSSSIASLSGDIYCRWVESINTKTLAEET